ncbi:MAG: transposase [Synechococcaceae cyanobacterium SM2_3_1]|nr:transposase [Synechococcaceae cyanobacterium SM2_3_1]
MHFWINGRNLSKYDLNSRGCWECGAIVKKSLSIGTHHCQCGCELHRDYNAALNILKLGPSKVGHIGTGILEVQNAWGEANSTGIGAILSQQVSSMNQESHEL